MDFLLRKAVDKFGIVQEKLSTLFSNVERLESEKHGISKSKFTTLENENTNLIKSIEDILNRYYIVLLNNPSTNFPLQSI